MSLPSTPTITSGRLWAPQATGRRVSSCWLQSCLASGTTAKHLIIQHFPNLRLQRPHVALLGVLRLLAGLEFACCTHIWSPDGGADPRLPGVHQVAGSLRLWPVCPLSILPVFSQGLESGGEAVWSCCASPGSCQPAHLSFRLYGPFTPHQATLKFYAGYFEKFPPYSKAEKRVQWIAI